MNHLGHFAIGLIVGVAAMLLLNAFSPQLIAIALLASVLPDIDLKQSKASKIVEPIAIIATAVFLYPVIISKYAAIPAMVISLAISTAVIFLLFFPLRLKHRGVT
ncbi:MAG: metal-dependent hydrolase, partial [Candidatus Micrarchaeota archaeon]